MSSSQNLVYSQLFSQLINSRDEMDDTMASFLYYLFPQEMFVKALSLIDSNEMFIYVLENSKAAACSQANGSPAVDSDGNENKFELQQDYTELLYNEDSSSDLLTRLIIRSHNDCVPPTYVDLARWFCSCEEYSRCMQQELIEDTRTSLTKKLIHTIDDVQHFSDDKFAQFDARSLSKQIYKKESDSKQIGFNSGIQIGKMNSGNGNSEESYSMYSKTSSPPPPPPHQTNMHFPAYQTAMPIYTYPQGPYMYAGQMPGYHFNMMGQNQMMYQHNGIPQAGDAKKKWNNNGGMSNGKVNHYQSHQHSASYHPQSTAGASTNSSGSSVSGASTNATTKSGSTSNANIKYKFEISKLNDKDSDLLSTALPLYFSTNEDEYQQARKIRNALSAKIFSDKTETIEPSVNEIERSELQDLVESQKEEVDASKVEESKRKSAKETIPKIVTSAASSNENLQTSSVATLSSTPTAPEPPAPKSWSAIASSAIAKGKNASAASSTTSVNSTPAQSTVSQAPQKKDKKYVPSTNVGLEPLGSISLRMCFDPDFVNYTIEHNESILPIKSIIPRGIINRVNICFMSSVLQVLLYCKPFINIMNVISIKNGLSKATASNSKLLDACIAIYSQFDRSTYESEKRKESKAGDAEEIRDNQKYTVASPADAIKPDDFYKVLSTLPKFKDLQWGHQEDAEEFLTHLLDQLHEEFIAVIDHLTDAEIQNLLQSLSDEDLKTFFIRNLSQYKKANFLNNASNQLKALFSKYGSINDENDDEGNGWHEVSASSKRGKKSKTAAKRTVEIESSPISNLFGGQFRSVLDIPNNKESQSITLDPFQTIQLDISDPSVNDLKSAFKKFSEYELLPFKSSSGNDVEAKKQTFIDRLPQVLLVQLKRFSFINSNDKDNNMMNYNAFNGRIEKIRKKINYEHELTIPLDSLSPSSSDTNSRSYSLTGVIYHHGSSSDGGHYTADVYHKASDQWYRIDDVNITPLQKSEVLDGGENGTDTRTAYILMYEKNNE